MYKIWVYGNSFKSVLVAVVVPNEDITKKWADLNGHMMPFSELCSLDQLKKYVLSELNSTAERNKVTSYGIETVPFASNFHAVVYLCFRVSLFEFFFVVKLAEGL